MGICPYMSTPSDLVICNQDGTITTGDEDLTIDKNYGTIDCGGSNWVKSDVDGYYLSDIDYEPSNVLYKDSTLDKNSDNDVTKLSKGEWAFGNEDGLSRDVLYIRLSDDEDPNEQNADDIQIESPFKVKFCELWDFENGMCGAKVTGTIANSSSNEHTTLISLLESVLGKESEKDDAAVGATILTLWNHYHDSHNHQNPHKCVDLPSECGSAQKCMNPPYANDLIQEYSGNEDMDGNDKIYGFDFKIDDDDQDKPPMLKGIQKSVDWPDPSETMTWQEYVDEREGRL